MSDKVQLIKEEIERLKEENSIGLCEYDAGYCNGVGETCNNILSFIDSLPEEHNENLEEAAKEWAENHFQDFIEVEDDPGYWCSRFGFIAGAEWQKQKDFEDLLKSDMTQFKKCYEKGWFDMREEMMKALIGGEIVKDIHNQLSVKSEPLNDAFRDSKFGEKVKIIIVKEEQQ